MRRSLAPWMLLLLLATTATAQVDMVFGITLGGRLYPIEFTEAGKAQAAELLRQALDADYRISSGDTRSTRSWELVELLFDPAIRSAVEANAGLSGPVRLKITLNPGDSVHQIFAGEVLAMPDGSRYTVMAGDTLGQIASAQGTSVEAIRKANRDRFQVWATAGYGRDARGDYRHIRFGAEAMSGRTRGDVHETLLHEAAHVGDPSTCPHAGLYGPDGSHSAAEVVSPAGAFTEGWAVYRAFAAGRQNRISGWVLSTYPRQPQLVMEDTSRAYAEGEANTFALGCWEITLAEVVANEMSIARVLERMDTELPGGAAALEEAFRYGRHVECRTLADFLEATVRLYPEQRDALAALLADQFAEFATGDEIRALMEGQLPEVGGARLDPFQHGWIRLDTRAPRPAWAPCESESTTEVPEVEFPPEPQAPASGWGLGSLFGF